MTVDCWHEPGALKAHRGWHGFLRLRCVQHALDYALPDRITDAPEAALSAHRYVTSVEQSVTALLTERTLTQHRTGRRGEGEDGKAQVSNVTEKCRTNQVDHPIAPNALYSMKDGGCAVLILGSVKYGSDANRKKGYRSKAKFEFYSHLYNKYNVVDHFTVPGSMYSKQGAKCLVDVVTIDGWGKSAL